MAGWAESLSEMRGGSLLLVGLIVVSLTVAIGRIGVR